jgi:hypothetical protein
LKVGFVGRNIESCRIFEEIGDDRETGQLRFNNFVKNESVNLDNFKVAAGLLNTDGAFIRNGLQETERDWNIFMFLQKHE